MNNSWTEGTFEGLLESAPDAMVIIERSGSIVLVNSRTEELFGYTRSELIGQKIEILLPERFRGPHVRQRDGYFSRPTVRPMGARIDLFGRHKQGKEFPVEISLSPLQTQSGLLVTGAIRDISERKQIENDLKRAREAADAANRSKSEFLANMSHEIRTPLAGILGYAEMLIHYCKTDEERKDYGVKIKRNADNLTELINDILDLSKVEAGALKLEQIPFPLMKEVEAVLTLLQLQAEEKGIGIETLVDRPIPDWIVGDPKRLRQVLINLLGNAIKFTEEGKVTLKIKLDRNAGHQKQLQKPLLSFEVIDTGCGIDPASHGKLFRPFVQADSSTTRKYGGTGLGLALSLRLARAMSGDLVLRESTPGKGSTFVFTLDPGALEKHDRTAHAETPPSHGQRDIRLDGVRVLVAEDNADNEHLVTQFLTHAGATVEVARNGVEAVAMVQSRKFDVVLMDIQMPILDGCEATRRLRSEGYKLPIVAVTAHAMVEERERCMAAGCSDFLTKPLDVAVLLATVQKLS